MPSPFPRRPLGRAGLAFALALALQAAQAQTANFDIPAQPLARALDLFARQAGLQLVYDPALARERQAPALHGERELGPALDELLRGSGLDASIDGGTLSLRPAADRGGSARLAEIRVKARRAGDGTTEGSGSYTSRVTAIASKTDQSFREIPQSVSVITRQQLDDLRLLDIRDAMAATPGITTSQLNADSSYFYARGFQIDSLSIDGGPPLNIASYTYSVNQDMAFYDRVEVMRGASGLLGGVGDPGGLINVVRKKPLAEPRLVLEQSIGRWNQARSMVDVTGPLALEGRVRGRAVLSYLDTDSFIDHRAQRTPQLYGVIEADLTPATLLTVGASHARQKLWGVGGGQIGRATDGSEMGLPRSTGFAQPWATSQRNTTELFTTLEHSFDNRWKLKLNLMRSKSDVEGGNAFGYGALDRASGTGVFWYGGGHYLYSNEQTVADASLAGTFSALGRTHELLLGVDRQEVESYWNVAYPADGSGGVVPIDVDEPGLWTPAALGPLSRRYNPWGQKQSGAYGVLRLHPTDRLHLIAGARHAKYSFNQVYETLNADGSWGLASGSRFSEPSKTTPYGGLIFDLDPRWSAYVSYASILKPQALSKAGPPPGESLEPIRGKAYEAGLKGELAGGALNATFSLFRVDRTGTAVADPRYPNSSELWSGSCCHLPQGKVSSRGFDAEIGGLLAPGWQMSAGYTYTRTRDESTGAVFSEVTPRHMLKLSTAWTLPGELSHWKLGTSASVRSKQAQQSALYDADWNPIGTVDIRQGGYTVWNAMAQLQASPQWAVALNLNNLFDKRYVSTLGYLEGGNFIGTPREWLLTVRGTF